MVAELVLAPEVEVDLGDAYGWYEDQRHGLGEEFLGCVEACIRQLRRAPELHAKVHEDYRPKSDSRLWAEHFFNGP